MILSVTSIMVTLFAIIFSPLIALFVQSNGYLPLYLKWFQMVDNPATGDLNWNHGVISYWNTVRWLIRNPAQGFDSICGANVAYDSLVTKNGQWIICNGYFEFDYVSAIPWFFGEYCLISFGWRLKNILNRYPHPTQGQLISWPIRFNKKST